MKFPLSSFLSLMKKNVEKLSTIHIPNSTTILKYYWHFEKYEELPKYKEHTFSLKVEYKGISSWQNFSSETVIVNLRTLSEWGSFRIFMNSVRFRSVWTIRSLEPLFNCIGTSVHFQWAGNMCQNRVLNHSVSWYSGVREKKRKKISCSWYPPLRLEDRNPPQNSNEILAGHFTGKKKRTLKKLSLQQKLLNLPFI